MIIKNKDILAPILLFVYNRPDHTRKTVESLKLNRLAKESILYVFSDAAKSAKDVVLVKKVRKYIDSITGFKQVIVHKRKRNLGLANSVITGVNEVIYLSKKVIVVEDDLQSSSQFLDYMNSALNFYENDKKIFSVTGYNYPDALMKIPTSYHYDVYISNRPSSWGWATWLNRWVKVDWEVRDFNLFWKDKQSKFLFNQGGEDLSNMLLEQMNGKIDSWAIRWAYSHYTNRSFCLHPIKSLINNIGNDGSGTHCDKMKRDIYFNRLNNNADIRFVKNIEVDTDIMLSFRAIFHKSIIDKFKMFIAKIIFYNKWKKYVLR